MVSLKPLIINTVPNCDCQKWIEYSDENDDADILYTDTTCGETAYARGKGQRVVGFSFYGNPGQVVVSDIVKMDT